MSAEIAELVGLGVSLSREPVTEAQRVAYHEVLRHRTATAAAELAVCARLSANGEHGPAADAAVLLEAGLFPVGSIMSPDYAPPAEGLARI
jgi:hypothetical protein